MATTEIEYYQQMYDELPFEETMAAFRKNIVIKFLTDRKCKNILEVGCGNDSIINHYKDFEKAVVVEPSPVFFERLKKINTDPAKEIIFINDFFSAALKHQYDFTKTDAVVISGLLHELPEPEKLLKDVFTIIGNETAVHINVPNANSFHRLLAVEAGIIKDVKELSVLQKQLKQPHTFTLSDLKSLAQICGFTVFEEGSYFIKPFTHKQMAFLQMQPMFGKSIIDGLDKMIKYFPENGSEIFLNLVKK